ncbi:MAG: MBL fold metallo-hydrolase [Patulibacter minatonensis]
MLHANVAEGVHRIEDAYVNWYLVEDGDALTIVDAGHPASWGSLHRALRAIGRPPGEIEAVVLTHGHFDHLGFAERARRTFGVPVWAPTADQPLAAHPWRYDHERSRLRQAATHPSFIRVFATMGAAGALWVRGCRQTRGYEPGTTLDVPGHPIAVPTPGHTLGHCALLFPRRGALLTGDALVTFDPYTGRRGPRIVSGAATADSARALGSLDALAELDARVLLPGHGGQWYGSPGRAVQQARAAATTRR